MSKHTQGPLTPVTDEYGVTHFTIGNGSVVAKGIFNNKADINLFSVAPDMLEALQFAQKYHAMKMERTGEGFPTQLINCIDIAIGKALGIPYADFPESNEFIKRIKGEA